MRSLPATTVFCSLRMPMGMRRPGAGLLADAGRIEP